MQANRILEVGTAYGGSTLWMAFAMPPAGRIWTIDPDLDRSQVALGFIERAGVRAAIEVINQPALEVLQAFNHRNLDIVFIDADPANYTSYLELCIPMLKRSGLVIVDDLLNPAAERFNRTFLGHADLDATIIPVGKGVGIGARIT